MSLPTDEEILKAIQEAFKDEKPENTNKQTLEQLEKRLSPVVSDFSKKLQDFVITYIQNNKNNFHDSIAFSGFISAVGASFLESAVTYSDKVVHDAVLPDMPVEKWHRMVRAAIEKIHTNYRKQGS